MGMNHAYSAHLLWSLTTANAVVSGHSNLLRHKRLACRQRESTSPITQRRSHGTATLTRNRRSLSELVVVFSRQTTIDVNPGGNCFRRYYPKTIYLGTGKSETIELVHMHTNVVTWSTNSSKFQNIQPD